MKTQKFLQIILAAAILAFNSPSLYSQDTPVSICENVRVITAKQGARLQQFMKYKYFEQATLFESSEGLYFNIIYKVDNVFQFDKLQVSREEVESICQEISEQQIESKTPIDESYSQEGRRRLIWTTTMFGMYYSLAIPSALGVEDYKGYTASYLLIGGTSFFLPLFGTNKNEVSYGMASGFGSGASLGIIHGGALSLLLQGDEVSGRTFFGLTSTFSIAEGIVGYSLAKKHNYSWGKTSVFGSGGAWGAAFGAALPALLFESENPRSYGLFGLAGSVGGMVGGSYLYNRQPLTAGDVSYMNTSGLIGFLWSTVLVSTIEPESSRLGIAIGLLGTSGGLAYGISRTKNFDYTYQQANLIALGSAAGALIGAGIGVLVEAEPKGYMWLTAMGTTGGFLLTDRLLAGSSKQRNSGKTDFSFNVNPAGVVGAFNTKLSATRPSDPRFQNSIVNMKLSF